MPFLDRLDRLFQRIENRPYRAERVVLAILFVGLTRTAEEVWLGHVRLSLAAVSQFTAFYVPVYLAFSWFAALLTRRRWQQTAQVVCLGIFAGILPPLIDVIVSGPGGFLYKYLEAFYPLFHRPGYPIGETITAWLSIAAFGIYVFLRSHSLRRTLIGLILAYLFSIFMAIYYPGFSSFLRNLDAIPLSFHVVQGEMLLLLGLLIYVAMNAKRLWPSLKRIHHALPWVILVGFGAESYGTINALTLFYAVLILFINQGVVLINDYYDRESDRINHRPCSLDHNDLIMISVLISWIALALFFEQGTGLLYVLYVVVTMSYHHPAIRLKDLFPLNHLVEGTVAVLALLIGMASVGVMRLSGAGIGICLLGWISFALGTFFKDYKDIPGDRASGTQTFYTLLMGRGLAVATIHRRVIGLLICLMLVPLPVLYFVGAPLGMLFGSLPFVAAVFWSLRHPAPFRAVSRTIWLLNGYLVWLVLALCPGFYLWFRQGPPATTDSESVLEEALSLGDYSKLNVLVSDSISRGIDFLFREQLDYGEFKTQACKDDLMSDCYFDSSPFVTTFVLYSLKDVKNKKVAMMKEKAVNYLLNEQGPGGTWKYFSSRNSKQAQVPPDLDDTALVSFALKLNNMTINNTALILGNRSKDGWFLTWFPTPYLYRYVDYNNVDCVVNANVLLYLGKNDPVVCSKISKVILSHGKCALYYPDSHPERFALFYSISRAYAHGISCFQESKNQIVGIILSLQKQDGSFGSVLETNLALNTLMNFGYREKEIARGVLFLLQKQSKEGFWERGVFFHGPTAFYGSEELSTAFAIEALQKWLSYFAWAASDS